MTTEYLPLAEYSNKYKVSISTLRRKIKSKDLQFIFSDNKYLILDLPPSTHQRHRPSLSASETSLMSVSDRPSATESSFTHRPGSVVVERAPFFSLSNSSDPNANVFPISAEKSGVNLTSPSQQGPEIRQVSGAFNASKFESNRKMTSDVSPAPSPIQSPIERNFSSNSDFKSAGSEGGLKLFQSPEHLQEQFHLLRKKLSASKAHEETVIATANKLLGDLKRAYAQVLQEKEEQILGLRQEIADLKTLVQVLESENQRLNGRN